MTVLVLWLIGLAAGVVAYVRWRGKPDNHGTVSERWLDDHERGHHP
jgi:hypothetical protein